MKRIRSNYHLLHALKVAPPRLRKAIVENSDKGLFLGIAELVLNVLKGNCKISDASTKRLRKHKGALRRMVDREVALKKKLVVQRGGFLIPLLTAALSALPSLLGL
jgi:hypothetical protein